MVGDGTLADENVWTCFFVVFQKTLILFEQAKKRSGRQDALALRRAKVSCPAPRGRVGLAHGFFGIAVGG